jgi:aspartyl-tRNA(Asn)/glutamyl-tRNA(Gln) amidotransferase subunit B
VLTAEKPLADYFEETLRSLTAASGQPAGESAKAASNWVMTDVLRVMGERKIGIDGFPVLPERLAGMIRLIQDGTISGKIAKDVFAEMLDHPGDPAAIVRAKGWTQVSDTGAIAEAVEGVVAANEAQVQKYRGGNEKVLGFFVGEVMKRMKGKANPGVVNALLKKRLAE